MNQVTVIVKEHCPYCAQALRQIQLIQPKYPGVEVVILDEQEHTDLAEQYDYFYLPAVFVDQKKIFEGAAYKADIERAFWMAANKNER